MKKMMKIVGGAQVPAGGASSSLSRVRAELDPMFYGDLETFRAAVANGTVDAAKGCRNMGEYHLSLERRHV